MAQSQALEVQEKKEVASREEKTVPARYYVPNTDIYETEDALTVVLEMPGVEKKDIEVSIEDDVVRIEAASTSPNTKASNRSTPSTMSGISPGPFRSQTRSTSSRSPRSWTTAC